MRLHRTHSSRGPGVMTLAAAEHDLHGLAVSLAGFERELAAMEAELGGFGGFGDLGAGAALATGVGASGAALVGGGALLTAGSGAGAAGVAAGTTALAVAGTASLATAAVIAAPIAIVGATAGWLASYRATTGNIRRLKAQIAQYRRKIVDIKRIYGKKRPGVAARRVRYYERRIRMARRRLDRIERVMKRRIERRKGRGKELTARQERVLRALQRRGKPVVRMAQPQGPTVGVAQQERLVSQADAQEVRMGLPGVPQSLSVVASRSYVDRALPIAQDLVAQGVVVEAAAQRAVAQVAPPPSYADVVLRRVLYWLRRNAQPQRFQTAQGPAFGPRGYIDPSTMQSGAFNPFPVAAMIAGQGGQGYAPPPAQELGPVGADDADGDPALDGDVDGAIEDAEVPWYKRPMVLFGLAAAAAGGLYLSKQGKGGKGGGKGRGEG